MSQRPRGVEPEEVARHLGKSTETATYLLNSLCQEGYAELSRSDGHYHLHTTCQKLVLQAEPSPAEMPESRYVDALDDLYEQTGQRAYLISVEDRALVVQEARGRQGLPTMPGLGVNIREEAHAVAVGKVILASSPGESVAAYIEAFGLHAFTQHTVTDVQELQAQARSINRLGYGVDREEFASGFSCIAAPLFDAAGTLRGALGLSTTATRFVEKRERFTSAVRDIAQTASTFPSDQIVNAEAVC